jgi:transposase-like protein
VTTLQVDQDKVGETLNMLKIQEIVDDAKCYEQVRALRWPDQVTCPHCESRKIKKRGFHSKQPARQRYRCRKCKKDFDDLSQTPLAGHHQPLKVWLLCLYFMGLNLSNRQIAQELELNQDDVHQMTADLRQMVYARRHPVQLTGEVEFDEVYLVAGHKGHPAIVRALGRDGRRNRLKGARGRGTLAVEKPPIFGMIQRSGELLIQMLPNVQQQTIQPLIQRYVQPETLIYTDDYNIYARLVEWGYAHKTVNHAQGEYARDEDGDGFHEVHTNTIEGVWSLLRSWLRPHRGISQEKLPFYLAFFAFVHNVRKRGKALLPSLLQLLLLPASTTIP